MLTVEWIAQAVRGKLYNPDRSVEIKGFSIDTRTLRAGDFFIALKGVRTDGHYFLLDACHKGASGALIQSTSSQVCKFASFKNIVRVEDTYLGLRQLARAYRQEFDIPIIGITGSSGKTTTKELLYKTLSEKYRAYRSPGNLNTEYGLPLALLNMSQNTEIAVFELGMQRRGEIKELADILKPTIGVITSIGDAHLGFFEGREALAQAKWELIEALPKDGLAVLNKDSLQVCKLTSDKLKGRKRKIEFAIESQADHQARDIRDEDLSGLSFEVASPKGRFKLNSALLGRFNVYNIMAAVAVAVELGVNLKSIQKAVQEFRPIPHRMELKKSKLGLILDDCYNASPSATQQALLTLSRLQTPLKKIFVFGDMRELGDFSEQEHKKIAAHIAELKIEQVFTLGELAAETAKALIERHGWNPERVKITQSREELKATLTATLKGDQNLILIKGSRAMELDKLVDGLTDI